MPQVLQSFGSFNCFWTIRILTQNVAPRTALVVKLFFLAIESKRDALPVVAIESVVIQVIRKLRRAVRGNLAPFETAPRLARKLVGGFLSGIAECKQHLRSQGRMQKRVQKDASSRYSFKLVCAADQMRQTLVIAVAS